MRILHISPSYYPAFKYGGPIQSVHLLNRALAKKGVNVEVFTTNAGLEENKEIKTNKLIELDGIKVKYFNYYGYEHYTFSPQMFLDLLMNERNYDLVHITAVWNFPVLAGSIVSLMYKKPFIISPRGTLYPETFNLKSKIKKVLYYNLLAKHYIYKASLLHFTSCDEKQKVVKFLKLRNENVVIPNGIDLSDYEKLPAKGSFSLKHFNTNNQKYILFLGRINPKKGLDILVKAIKNIFELYRDLYLVITGPDNDGYGNEIKQQLNEFSLLDKVLFTGMLNGDEKLAAFVDAELFVLPSYSENFGMAVVEALACGTPVVISNKVGICREIELNRAGIVVETDPKSLFIGIKTLLDNEELRREVAKNGRRLVEEYYDIDKVADKMIKTYQEVARIAK